jgi:hypothetical protein
MDHRIEEQWTTEAGYPAICMIVHGSHRCGYVGVPQGHPAYHKEYDTLHLSVHGGVTFTDLTGPKPFENLADKEYPVPTDDYIWWVGFDCAHAYDGFIEHSMLAIAIPNNGPVRSRSYVMEECESLARQLKEMDNA